MTTSWLLLCWGGSLFIYMFLLSLLAQRILSLQLVESPIVQYLFWVSFSLVFILFSVSIVQVISTHAIGEWLCEHISEVFILELEDLVIFEDHNLS